MQLFQLVRYLDENAIHLVVEEGRLRVTGGQELLTADVVAALKQHRDALLALVASEIASGPPAFADVSEAPLSFAQRRMYFLHQYDPLATHFILPVEMALHGPLHGERFVAALERVVARHRIYRTTYFVQDGVASQRFRSDLTFRVEQVDLSGCGTASAEAELENQRDRVMHRPFDLADELPIRASLLRLADDHHVFMLGFHHIATDEWSIQQFVAELAKTYRSLDGEGQDAPEAALPPSYMDYAAWQVQRFAAGALEPARSYWAYTLHGAKGVLELPLDHPRPAQQGYRGRLLERKLPGALQQRVAAFAREHRSSEYACYLGAYALLLSRLTGERDLVIGTDVYGREHPGTQDTAGFFVNQLALRCVVPIGASVEGYLEGVQETVKDALDYQEMPFDQLVDDLGVERDPAFPPLFQVKFLYARDSRDLEQFDGITLRERASDTVLSQYDLTLKVSSEQVKVWFNRDLLRVETVARWLDMYFVLLEECLHHPAADVDGTLGHVLEQQLLPLVQGEHVEVDATRLFEGLDQSVERTPDAIAVRSPVGDLSYSQLQTMVGRIASRLSRMGMRPGDRVGVYLERSPEMAAAVIAVLRTGGVLVPLDSSYPADHTEHTLADSSIAIIITRSSLSDYLPEFFGFTLDVETLGEHDTFDESYPVIDPESPAYLLYTSGSTGLPKGVFISHRAFANLCDWYVRFAELDAASRLLLMIPIGFDASLKNIVAPVIAGGQLILAPAEGFDPAGLLDVIATAGVSIINCAPSAAYALLREAQRTGFHSLASMRLLALGGEALDRSQLSPWLSSEVCNSRVANIYGPTECADISVAFVADKAQWLALPQVVIGRPIQNTRAYVLDGSQRLCPRGVVGELVMVGDGVGLGYHQRPELTGKSFVDLPVLGGRGYLTGDYCRYDA
ncbi:non-ribosomal peptide synthetase, partial [Stenotrophomonas sp. P5_B8]